MTVLKTRISLGSAMLALFFGILYLDNLLSTDIFIGLVALFIGSVGLLEFYKMAEEEGVSPFRIPGVICGIVIFVNVWLSTRGDQACSYHLLNTGAIVILVFAAFVVQGLRGDFSNALKDISVTIFGVLYVFFFLSFLMALYHLPGGNGVFDFLFVVLVSKVADIGGYLFGRKFGKHKLSPRISPKKTVEGLVCGLVLSVIVAWLLCLLTGKWIISWPWLTPFALIVALAGVFGDLAESLLKRSANVKDSGNYIPTFGGALDVIDSLLISMPVAYYFLVFVK
ncbi:MAG: phosphatidate cytidylyltransferase [Candidatus Anammoxibacter sp.]